MEKALQKVEPTLKLFIWLVIVFALILAAYLRPSDYEIKNEIRDQIFLVIKERNSRNKDFLSNGLVSDIVWNEVDRSVEIKDLFLFKIFIIHLNNPANPNKYGFGAFEKIDIGNINWNEVTDDLGNKKVAELPKSNSDGVATSEYVAPLNLDTPAVKKQGKSNLNIPGNIIYGTWEGQQDAYPVKNSSGEDMVVNGQTVMTPICHWKFILREDGTANFEQTNLENHTTAYYNGTGGDDANISNGITLLHYTVSSSDRTSTFNLNLRLTHNKDGLCIPDANNGPSFSIIKEQ
ncbi:MAG TPA: hypothetical protein VHD83_08475 [Puia sp.]|nr:hypothetical protein [Puia sp.]